MNPIHKTRLLLIAAAGVAFVAVPRPQPLPSANANTQEPPSSQDQGAQDQEMMKAMQAKAHLIQPGKHHKQLERFLGTWKTETRLFMGGQATPASAGEATFSWLMPGRWIKLESKGQMMGRPISMFWMMGYDNFKQSFVCSSVSSMDTAMMRAEGDMDPSGKALLLYGTIDEYLTGEHDKMVKTVFRFPSDVKIVMEVHDLPIGEQNTKVWEMVFHKVK